MNLVFFVILELLLNQRSNSKTSPTWRSGRGVVRVWREWPLTSITRKWRVRSTRKCQKSSLAVVSWGKRERILSPVKSLAIDGPE